MNERRSAVRQRTLLRGRVIYDHGRRSADCIIRDMSENGAKLVFSSTVPIADIVDLEIPAKGETMRARVRWRSEDEVGVSFRDSSETRPDAPVATGDLAGRVAALEQEVAALKRHLRRVVQAQEGPALE